MLGSEMPEWEHGGSGFDGIIGMTNCLLVQENLHAYQLGAFSMDKAVA